MDESTRPTIADSEALFASLYADLHRLARRELSRSDGSATLGVTTLLHEAYVEMSARAAAAFPDRARFMGYASRVMRGLIIDHARHRRAQKRGGRFEITSLDAASSEAADPVELSRIGEALDALSKTDPALAELVDLKFFCGFSFAEIAAMQRVSERTIQRNWEKARIYLYNAIRATLDG
jgi:RNA polymerase sigma factor (TIGR02999 family)